MIRADLSDPNWNKVYDLLLKVPYSQLISFTDWEREDLRCFDLFPVADDRKLFSYQIFTGNSKVSVVDISRTWFDLTLGLVKIIQELNNYY